MGVTGKKKKSGMAFMLEIVMSDPLVYSQTTVAGVGVHRPTC
jgi:hypothetical protein